MGEARYEMKLVYKSAEEAKKALPKIKKFTDDLNALYELWQNERFKTASIDSANRVAKLLQNTYPKIFKQLGLGDIKPDQGLNCYSGEIAAGADFNIEQKAKNIFLSAVIWHCSDWSRHAQAMVKYYKATKVYLRDEESVRHWAEAK